MAEQTSSGGSNATDFQPTTDNPQSNVGGGLQPNSANLQPVTTNGSNVFNQPGVNPQAFPKTDSLRVLSTNTQTLVPPSQTETAAGAPGWNTFTLFFVAAVIAVAALLVIARVAKPAGRAAEKQPEVLPPPVVSSSKAKHKKKSANRRKKAGKKKNRR